MTTKTATQIPSYELVMPAGVRELGLYDYDGDATFYRIKGKRVAGVIAVGMASHYGHDRYGRAEKDTFSPAMWAELSPRMGSKDSPNRLSLRMNGKSYGSVRAAVTFLPSRPIQHDGDDRTRWYPVSIVDGQPYLIAVGFDQSPSTLTDTAEKILKPLLQKIAAEYVTTERWHRQHIREALAGVQAAKKVVAKKQAALDEAEADLAKAVRWSEVVQVRHQLEAVRQYQLKPEEVPDIYPGALARYRKVGASRADDAALMAAFCADSLQTLVGAVSPELVWGGAQKRGMTTKELAKLAHSDVMAVSELQWI